MCNPSVLSPLQCGWSSIGKSSIFFSLSLIVSVGLEIVIFLFPLYLSMLFKKRPLERELVVFFCKPLSPSLYCCQLSCQGLQPHFRCCCCPHVDIIRSALLARRKRSASLQRYCSTVYSTDSWVIYHMEWPNRWVIGVRRISPHRRRQQIQHTQEWKNIPQVITPQWALLRLPD